MTTRLESPLKREVLIKGEPYRLTISPLGLHLARKGRRKGYELSWADFVNGDAALAQALSASVLDGPRSPAVAAQRARLAREEKEGSKEEETTER
jgi:hypothetical protein